MKHPNAHALHQKFKVPESIVNKLYGIFQKFDADGDGCVTEPEIKAAMNDAGYAGMAGMVRNIMQVSDADGDGKMEFEEFLSVLTPQFKAKNNEDNMESMFAALDGNSDGFITPEELLKAWSSAGDSITIEEARGMIAACDKDGNGKADLKEFKKLIKHL